MKDTVVEVLTEYLPFFAGLSDEQKERLRAACVERSFAKGALLHRGAEDCVGLMLVKRGQLRVYTLSAEGRELTLYRLFPRDMCLLSASCMINSIQFDVFVSAAEDTDVIRIPPDVYKALMERSLPVANYTNQLMAGHFSDVMWLMDQMMSKRMDSRLAALLIEEQELCGGGPVTATHEQLANHLGSAREVMTRMLKYFQNEGLVRLNRGAIEITDEKALREIAGNSLR